MGLAAAGDEAGDTRPAREAQVGRAGAEWRAAFAGDVHSYLREQIRFADEKATFLFATVTALLAYFHEKGLTRPWDAAGVGAGVAGAAALCLLAGALGALLVVVPRLGGSRTGMLFWEGVAGCRSATDYAERVASADALLLSHERLEHCYELSRVCRRKYRALTFAVRVGCLGLALGVVYLALF